jgi:hypothetical protein
VRNRAGIDAKITKTIVSVMKEFGYTPAEIFSIEIPSFFQMMETLEKINKEQEREMRRK